MYFNEILLSIKPHLNINNVKYIVFLLLLFYLKPSELTFHKIGGKTFLCLIFLVNDRLN